MKIAIDARPLRHPTSGIGKYTQKIVEHLTQAQDVTLLLYGCNPSAATARQMHSSQTLSALQMLTLHGCWARQDGADIYWSPRHHLPFRLGSLPSVVTIHDLSWRSHPQTLPRANLLAEQVLMPRSILLADRILVPSEMTQRALVDAYPTAKHKTTVTLLGGELDSSPVAQPRGDLPGRFVLFVGGDHPRKNLHVALDAFARASAYIDCDLMVAGPLRDAKTLNRRIEDTNLVSRVRLLGEVSAPELDRLYRHCHCVLMPSLQEGFGLPVVEAMQFGKPSIVSLNTSLAEVAGTSGVAINALDAAEIGRAICELVLDDAIYKDKSDRAEAMAGQFRWSKTSEASLRVFRELL